MIKKILLSTCLLLSLITFAADPPVQLGFPVDIPNSRFVRAGSTAVEDITGDGAPEIIVGDSQGKVYAYRSNGTELWRRNTGTASIESKPAVADLDLDGNMEVIISAGSTFTPAELGGVIILNGQTGVEICRYIPTQFSTATRGVYGAVAIGNLDKSDSNLEIALGDWSAKVSVLNHDCSILWQSQSPPAIASPLPNGYDETIPPFKVYVNDTVWSSPAIADINNDGQLDVIIGVDSHIDDNNFTPDGGRLLVINGNNGTLQFAIDTDEAIWSSPAIVDLDNDGNLDIVVGTGYCWQDVNCAPPPNGVHPVSNSIYAWDANGQNLAGWPVQLQNNYAVYTNSPAIADIDGDGFLEVVINTFKYNSPLPHEGKVFAFEHTGALKWGAIPTVPINQNDVVHYASNSASPIIADIDADGELDIIVPSNWELIVYDKNGSQLTRTNPNPSPGDLLLQGIYPASSTPSVADLDKDGDYEIILASGNAVFNPSPATIYVWDLDTQTSTFLPWGSLRNSIKNIGVYLSDLIFFNGFD